jgi:hypothetical protein
MPNETPLDSTGKKVDALPKRLPNYKEIPSYIERADDSLYREWEAKLTKLYLDHERLKIENARLRAIFPKILEALKSGGCSPDCSVEFMEMIPDEVRLVIRGHSLPKGAAQTQRKTF